MAIFDMKADVELQAALRQHGCSIEKRTASDYLFRQGDEPKGFYLIESGRARMYLENAGGEVLIEEAIGSGSIVGLPATVNGHPYSMSCELLDNAELLFISRENLIELMRTDTNSAVKLLDLLSTEVQAIRAEFSEIKSHSLAYRA